MSNPLSDMELPDVAFCIGTNMTEAHPVAATRLKKALARGSKLIVADPRRIHLATLADLYLPLRVGTDVALLQGMAHVIVRDGLMNDHFVATRTQHLETYLEHIAQFTPEWAESICEVPAADIEKAARWYAEADQGAIYYTLGITEHICGVDNVQCLCNLALLTGQIGRPGTGLNPMRGQNNIQGAGDSGAIPDQYPGFQAVVEPDHQRKFSKAYGREMDATKGITKVTAMEEAGRDIFAMLIDGENSVVSDPNQQHTREAIESLEHLVVIDIFLSETAEMADVVFPATAWAETDGTFTNTERRIQRVRQAVTPAGEARPDWWIISRIAQHMGLRNFDFNHPREVFNEMCSLSTTYAGVDWDLAATGRYHWPVPYRGHPGTPRLHEESFPIGRGKFSLIEYRDPAETVDETYPIWLTTGRRLATYHTNTQTGRAGGMDYLAAEEALEVNPRDLEAWDLQDGETVWLSSRRGRIAIKVAGSKRSPMGTVFSSFSFSDTPINTLTGSGYDPVTHTAELKVCTVRIDKMAVAEAVGG